MDLAAIVAKKKALQEEIKKDGAALLKSAFTTFFEAHPEVQAVRWRQYTPYFNDGDACTFGRHDFESRATDGEEFRDGWEHKYSGEKGGAAYDWKAQQAALDALGKELGSSELDDVFEMAFGDHAEVVATRDAFNVEEYSHD